MHSFRSIVNDGVPKSVQTCIDVGAAFERVNIYKIYGIHRCHATT